MKECAWVCIVFLHYVAKIYANISLHLGVRQACVYQLSPAGPRLGEMEGAMRKVKSHTILLEWISEQLSFLCPSAAGELL